MVRANGNGADLFTTEEFVMWDMYPMDCFKVVRINELDILCMWRGWQASESGYVAIAIV